MNSSTVTVKRYIVLWFVGVTLSLLGLDIGLLFRLHTVSGLATARFAELMIKPGAAVSKLSGSSASKQPFVFDPRFNGKDTLVLVFSPTCSVCDRNWPNWNQVIDKIDHQHLNIILVDLSNLSTSTYLKAHNVEGLPLMAHLDPQSILTYKFRLTPETLLVSRSGVVARAWAGELSDAAQKELVSAYGRQ